MAILVALSHISDMTELTGELPGFDTQMTLRKPLGELIARINVDLLRPIARAYPDLDPDRKDDG
jgi:hypothetical protein